MKAGGMWKLQPLARDAAPHIEGHILPCDLPLVIPIVKSSWKPTDKGTREIFLLQSAPLQ